MWQPFKRRCLPYGVKSFGRSRFGTEHFEQLVAALHSVKSHLDIKAATKAYLKAVGQEEYLVHQEEIKRLVASAREGVYFAQLAGDKGSEGIRAHLIWGLARSIVIGSLSESEVFAMAKHIPTIVRHQQREFFMRKNCLIAQRGGSYVQVLRSRYVEECARALRISKLEDLLSMIKRRAPKNLPQGILQRSMRIDVERLRAPQDFANAICYCERMLLSLRATKAQRWEALSAAKKRRAIRSRGKKGMAKTHAYEFEDLSPSTVHTRKRFDEKILDKIQRYAKKVVFIPRGKQLPPIPTDLLAYQGDIQAECSRLLEHKPDKNKILRQRTHRAISMQALNGANGEWTQKDDMSTDDVYHSMEGENVQTPHRPGMWRPAPNLGLRPRRQDPDDGPEINDIGDAQRPNFPPVTYESDTDTVVHNLRPEVILEEENDPLDRARNRPRGERIRPQRAAVAAPPAPRRAKAIQQPPQVAPVVVAAQALVPAAAAVVPPPNAPPPVPIPVPPGGGQPPAPAPGPAGPPPAGINAWGPGRIVWYTRSYDPCDIIVPDYAGIRMSATLWLFFTIAMMLLRRILGKRVALALIAFDAVRRLKDAWKNLGHRWELRATPLAAMPLIDMRPYPQRIDPMRALGQIVNVDVSVRAPFHQSVQVLTNAKCDIHAMMATAKPMVVDTTMEFKEHVRAWTNACRNSRTINLDTEDYQEICDATFYVACAYKSRFVWRSLNERTR